MIQYLSSYPAFCSSFLLALSVALFPLLLSAFYFWPGPPDVAPRQMPAAMAVGKEPVEVGGLLVVQDALPLKASFITAPGAPGHALRLCKTS